MGRGVPFCFCWNLPFLDWGPHVAGVGSVWSPGAPQGSGKPEHQCLAAAHTLALLPALGHSVGLQADTANYLGACLWHPKLKLWWPWSQNLRPQFLRTARWCLEASRRLWEEQMQPEEALCTRLLKKSTGQAASWLGGKKLGPGLCWSYLPMGLKSPLNQTKGNREG